MTKLLLITLTYNRFELTDFVFSYYKDLQKKLINYDIKLDLLACGSNGEISKNMTDKYGFKYVETPNQPLALKHNKLSETSKKYDNDGYIIIGSDDILSKELFLDYKESLDNGIEFRGFSDIYFLTKNNVNYWGGYVGERFGEPVGCGKMYSKSLMEKIDWCIWCGTNINQPSGFDSFANKRLKKINYTSKISKVKDIDGFMVDVKTNTNITNVNLFTFNEVFSHTFMDRFTIKYEKIKHLLV